MLQLNSVISYFDMYSQSIAQYENGDIPKIHLTAKEPTLDPTTKQYSERETSMSCH